MELNEKLQELRKRKGLTQEELAEKLFVSRAAISKWESGRGCPNIESLKALAAFFSVTVDDLLSEDPLTLGVQEDGSYKKSCVRDLAYGTLDCAALLFFFLPLFALRADGTIQEVSLLFLTGIAPYLKIAYFAVVAGLMASGILTLALQNCRYPIWHGCKKNGSLAVSAGGALVFILSLQPYAAVFLFACLLIKVFLLIKWP